MTTAWAHLPNAALIDAVLADVMVRPGVWDAVWREIKGPTISEAWDAAWGAAQDAVLAAARSAVRDAAWDAAQDTTWNAVKNTKATGGTILWGAARDVLFVLTAWDDCAHLLDLPSDTLRTMADLCDAPACHQAVLLLPYVLVKEST